MKWNIVEHSWSDTSIYDQEGRLICTKSIDDEECTEENQDELEEQTSKDFGLIVLAPEMRDLLEYLSIFGNLRPDQHYKIEELLKRAEK